MHNLQAKKLRVHGNVNSILTTHRTLHTTHGTPHSTNRSMHTVLHTAEYALYSVYIFWASKGKLFAAINLGGDKRGQIDKERDGQEQEKYNENVRW